MTNYAIPTPGSARIVECEDGTWDVETLAAPGVVAKRDSLAAALAATDYDVRYLAVLPTHPLAVHATTTLTLRHFGGWADRRVVDAAVVR
jgi:hypothetical protein